VTAAVDTYGRLDAAFNNAGIEGEAATTPNCSEENFDLNIAVNLKGVFLCMKYQINQFLTQGGGAIVNTASVAGLVAAKGVPVYVAAKHGVIGLTKTAAIEFAKKGIRTEMLERALDEKPWVEKQLLRLQPIGRLGETARDRRSSALSLLRQRLLPHWSGGGSRWRLHRYLRSDRTAPLRWGADTATLVASPARRLESPQNPQLARICR
jgi:NAD(P)-dependent dehydrogenase (short-subunit alcohol dehydrogenase family)